MTKITIDGFTEVRSAILICVNQGFSFCVESISTKPYRIILKVPQKHKALFQDLEENQGDSGTCFQM